MSTLRSTITGRTGTLAFNSPETFNGKYSEASDIYAFGMFAYEAITRQVPFKGRSEAEITECVRQRFDEDSSSVQRNVKRGQSIEEQREEWIEDYPLSSRRPDLTLVEDGCPEALQRLITACWADDPNNRPSFAECCDELEAVVPLAMTLLGADRCYA